MADHRREHSELFANESTGIEKEERISLRSVPTYVLVASVVERYTSEEIVWTRMQWTTLSVVQVRAEVKETYRGSQQMPRSPLSSRRYEEQHFDQRDLENSCCGGFRFQ